jgi:hypothetical protein
MKLRVDTSHLQCMYLPGETARGVCLHTCRGYTNIKSYLEVKYMRLKFNHKYKY